MKTKESDTCEKRQKDMTKGIKCRRCGTTMFVYETKPGENYIIRYRECRSCNAKHKTIEQ